MSEKTRKIRLERLLANLGYGSRQTVGRAVKAGAFRLGDRVLYDPSISVDLALLSEATFEDEPLDPFSPLTILLHKPRGFTCSTDEQGKLVYDLLPPRWKNRTPVLSSAGRLDKESTGLVLMTDDGQLLHKIISPKIHVGKHYKVTLRDELRRDEAALFSSGAFCLAHDPKPLKPAIWTPEGKREGVMILQEGRYHQIRRMFAAIGNHVEALHRFRLGGLDLGAIPEGEYRILGEREVSRVFGEASP